MAEVFIDIKNINSFSIHSTLQWGKNTLMFICIYIYFLNFFTNLGINASKLICLYIKVRQFLKSCFKREIAINYFLKTFCLWFSLNSFSHGLTKLKFNKLAKKIGLKWDSNQRPLGYKSSALYHLSYPAL